MLCLPAGPLPFPLRVRIEVGKAIVDCVCAMQLRRWSGSIDTVQGLQVCALALMLDEQGADA